MIDDNQSLGATETSLLTETLALPEPFGYVTCRADGSLDGAYFQIPPDAHLTNLIRVDDEAIRLQWMLYQANDARDGLELLPPTPAPTPSPKQVIAQYMAAVQQHMDGEAVRFGYDNLVSVITYADEPAVPRYQAEGQAFRAWRSLVWEKCEEVLAAVQAGDRDPPTYDQLVAELPVVGIEPSSDVAGNT
jgi:hypothetical protein